MKYSINQFSNTWSYIHPLGKTANQLELVLSRCYTCTFFYILQMVVNISQLLIHKITLSTLVCHHSNASNKHLCVACSVFALSISTEMKKKTHKSPTLHFIEVLKPLLTKNTNVINVSIQEYWNMFRSFITPSI